MEFSFTINNELSDWRLYTRYLQKRASQRVTKLSNKRSLLLFSALFVVTLWTFLHVDYVHMPSIVAACAVSITFFTILIINMFRMAKDYEPAEDGIFVGEKHYVLNEQGIATKSEGYKGVCEWSCVKSVERNSGLIMVFLDSAYAYLFPEAQLDASDEVYEYVLKCCSHLSHEIA